MGCLTRVRVPSLPLKSCKSKCSVASADVLERRLASGWRGFAAAGGASRARLWPKNLALAHRLRCVEADCSSVALAEAVPAVPGPVGPIDPARGRDARLRMERRELPGSARQSDFAESGREIEPDVAERVVARPDNQNDVTIERGRARGLEIDDSRADLDRLEVRGSDRAEGVRQARVLRT